MTVNVKRIGAALAALYVLHIGNVDIDLAPADERTRIRVRNALNALMVDMQEHGEIERFRIICDATNNTPSDLENGWTNVSVFWTASTDPLKNQVWAAGSPGFAAAYMRLPFEVPA